MRCRTAWEGCRWPEAQRLQEVVDGEAVGETAVLYEEEGKVALRHVLLPDHGGWWLGDRINYDGIATYRLADAQLEATGLLIDHDPCEPNVTCVSPDHQPVFDARNLQAAATTTAGSATSIAAAASTHPPSRSSARIAS